MKPTSQIIILILAILTSLASAYAQTPREQLKQMAEQLQKTPTDNALREKIIKLSQNLRPAPAVPEEAERRMARGEAAFESAKDVSGYDNALREFQAAANAAPWYANAYFNLGVAQEKAGNAKEAMESFRFYLLAAPDGKDAAEVKKRIYKLEYAADQAARDFRTYSPSNGDFRISIPALWKVDASVSTHIFKDPSQSNRKLIVLWIQRFTPQSNPAGGLNMYSDGKQYAETSTSGYRLYPEGVVNVGPQQTDIGGRQFVNFITSWPQQRKETGCTYELRDLCEAGVYKYAVTDVEKGFYVLISAGLVGTDQDAAAYYKEFVRSFLPLKNGPEGDKIKPK